MHYQKKSPFQESQDKFHAEITKHAERRLRRYRPLDFLVARELTLNLNSAKEVETYLPGLRDHFDVKCLIEKERARHNRIYSYPHWLKLKQERTRGF